MGQKLSASRPDNLDTQNGVFFNKNKFFPAPNCLFQYPVEIKSSLSVITWLYPVEDTYLTSIRRGFQPTGQAIYTHKTLNIVIR